MHLDKISFGTGKIYPNLFIPGAAKSATSSFHEYLNQHPNIFMSKIKEPHFFCKNDYHSKWPDYLQLFDEGITHLFRGESSTGYMLFPNVVKRIKSNIPDPYFIFVLRNPIDRAYSHYWWLRGLGFEKKDFFNAFEFDYKLEPDYQNKFGPGYKYYFQFGLYGKWLKRYFQTFDKNLIHIITTESLKSNPANAMCECFQFLGISPYSTDCNMQHNKTIILKNPALNYYNFLAYSALRKSSLLKNTYHRIVAEKYRKSLSLFRSFILNKYILRKRAGNAYLSLTVEKRRIIASHYKNDIALLKKITGMDFSEWIDFRNT